MQILLEYIEGLSGRLGISLKIQLTLQGIVIFLLKAPHLSKMTDRWSKINP